MGKDFLFLEQLAMQAHHDATVVNIINKQPHSIQTSFFSNDNHQIKKQMGYEKCFADANTVAFI